MSTCRLNGPANNLRCITGIGPLIGESIQALISGHYMRHLPVRPELCRRRTHQCLRTGVELTRCFMGCGSLQLKLVKGETWLTVLQLSLAVAMGIVLPYVHTAPYVCVCAGVCARWL